MADSMFKKKNGTWNGKAIADYLTLTHELLISI